MTENTWDTLSWVFRKKHRSFCPVWLGVNKKMTMKHDGNVRFLDKLHETNSKNTCLKMRPKKETIIFQPSIFR